MNKIWRILLYIVIAVGGFGFFLYLAFPYKILKESIAIELSNMTGVSVTIDDLSPRFLLGLEANGVKLNVPGGTEVEFQEVSGSVSLLRLLLGNIHASVDVVDKTEGTLDLTLDFGIFDLMSGTIPFPSALSLEAEKFTFGNIAELILKLETSRPTMSPFIKPLLEKLGVRGKLNAGVDFDFDTSDFTKSKGSIALTLIDATLEFDPGMQIPSQRFENAVFKATSQNGTLGIDPSSRFKTKDIDVALTGKVAQKSKVEQSVLDLNINLQLSAELTKQFSAALSVVLGKAEPEGRISIRVSGPLLQGPEVKVL